MAASPAGRQKDRALLSVLLFLSVSWAQALPASGESRIVLSPTSYEYQGRVGSRFQGDLRVSNAGTSLLHYSITTEPAWLTVTPRSGSIYGGSSRWHSAVSYTPGLAPGDHEGWITVTSNDPQNPTSRIPVRLSLSPSRARIIVLTDSLVFEEALFYWHLQQSLVVRNPGEDWLSMLATSDVPWMNVTNSGLGIPSGKTDSLIVNLRTNEMAEGTHRGSITIATNVLDRPFVTIPVTARVTEPRLEAGPPTVTITAPWGVVASGGWDVSNHGSGDLYITKVPGTGPPSWLDAPGRVIVAPGESGQVSMTVNPAGLAVGDYSGAVSYGTNVRGLQSMLISVNLSVRRVPPTLHPARSTVEITRGAGSPPAGDLLQIHNSGSDTLVYELDEAVPWLRAGPDSGSVAPGGSAYLRIETAPAGLAPGTHEGGITVRSNDPSLPERTIPVALNVTPEVPEVDKDRIGVRELGFGCLSKGSNAAYLEITAFRAGEEYSSELVIRAEDREGLVLFEARGLLASQSGQETWEPGVTRLIAGPDFRNLFDLVPDALLPGPLDPVGGTISILRDVSPPEVLQRFHYGRSGGPLTPGPLRSLHRQDPAQFRDGDPSPRRASGLEGSATRCRPCPMNRLTANGGGLVTDSPGLWFPSPVDVPSPSSVIGYSHVNGTVHVGGRTGASAEFKDHYHVTAPWGGWPIEFKAFLRITNQLTSSGQYAGASGSVSLQRDDEPAATFDRSTARPAEPQNGYVTVPIVLDAGESFELTTRASVRVELHGGQGIVKTWLGFYDLPPGAQVVSCQGFTTPAIAAPEIRPIKASRSPAGIDVVWGDAGSPRLVTVARRVDSGPWSPVGSAEVDGGRVRFSDAGTDAGHGYEYRILNVDRTWGATMRVDPIERPPHTLAIHVPVPLHGTASIHVTLPDAGPAEVELFDVAGRLRTCISLEGMGPGIVPVDLDRGTGLSSGVYFLRLTHGEERLTERIVLIR